LSDELGKPEEPELLSAASVGAYLQARGVLQGRDSIRVEELGGGISNIVLAVSGEVENLVVKQALPRLRVDDEWLANRGRALNEARALQLAHAVTPESVPALLDVDPDLCALTMAAAPDGWVTWKERLLMAEADADVARKLGRILAAWHSATFRSDELSRALGDTEVFEELRIGPYYRTVARRRPELEQALGEYVRRMGATRVCLVHGDYSPKNVLIGEGLWVIDFEAAHFGDPAFDLAFMLNHLLLKRLHVGGVGSELESCVTGFWQSYGGAVPDVLTPDTRYVLGHVGCLMVARVDGKSPAEYLTPEEKEAARTLGSRLLLAPPDSLDAALDLTAGAST
jgi:aminoglycoside phosphotransferase (APT) family kinase protein